MRYTGAASGTWRSLVAHLLWEQGVASSNLAVPTRIPAKWHFPWTPRHCRDSVAQDLARKIALDGGRCAETTTGKCSPEGRDLAGDDLTGRGKDGRYHRQSFTCATEDEAHDKLLSSTRRSAAASLQSSGPVAVGVSGRLARRRHQAEPLRAHPRAIRDDLQELPEAVAPIGAEGGADRPAGRAGVRREPPRQTGLREHGPPYPPYPPGGADQAVDWGYMPRNPLRGSSCRAMRPGSSACSPRWRRRSLFRRSMTRTREAEGASCTVGARRCRRQHRPAPGRNSRAEVVRCRPEEGHADRASYAGGGRHDAQI